MNDMSTMMELKLNEMAWVSAGSGETGFDAFKAYGELLNQLFDKYGCWEKGGFSYLMTVCTPEEKARIMELWHMWQGIESQASGG